MIRIIIFSSRYCGTSKCVIASLSAFFLDIRYSSLVFMKYFYLRSIWSRLFSVCAFSKYVFNFSSLLCNFSSSSGDTSILVIIVDFNGLIDFASFCTWLLFCTAALSLLLFSMVFTCVLLDGISPSSCFSTLNCSVTISFATLFRTISLFTTFHLTSMQCSSVLET